VADDEARTARVIVVGGIHTHAGSRDARLAERYPRGPGRVREGPVPLVAIEPVRLRVVRHEQVHPAVAVEIEHRDAESFRRRVVEPGAPGDSLERAVAAVVIERRALPLVRLGGAVRLALAVERAEQVLLD